VGRECLSWGNGSGGYVFFESEGSGAVDTVERGKE
jgi:hypothetical protein